MFFNNQESLLIQMWFFPVLFVIALVHFGILKFAEFFGINKFEAVLALGIILYTANIVLSVYGFSGKFYSYCSFVNCVLSSYIFYALGYFYYRNANLKTKMSIKKFFVCVGLVFGSIYLNKYIGLSVDVRQNKINDWTLYLPNAIIGIQVIMFFSELTCMKDNILARLLCALGGATRWILIMHILVFKIISLFQLYVFKIPYEGDLRFWGNVNTEGIWSYIYCFLGTLIPLIGQKIQYIFMKKREY